MSGFDPDPRLPFRIVQTDEEYRRRTRREERRERLVIGTAGVIALLLLGAVGFFVHELGSGGFGL